MEGVTSLYAGHEMKDDRTMDPAHVKPSRDITPPLEEDSALESKVLCEIAISSKVLRIPIERKEVLR